MKILIVDDRMENRYLLESSLRTGGYDVLVATNGVEALEILHDTPVDMIVTDILMPKMDGFQLCREVKGDENLKKIPFIFYTASYTTPDDKKFGLKIGADRYIIKPMDPDQFLEVINEVLQTADMIVPAEPAIKKEEEDRYLQDYSSRLFGQLERKLAQLEEKNRELVESKIELMKSESKFLELFDNVRDAVFLHRITPEGLNGNISEVNSTACLMLGYTREELLNMNVDDINSSNTRRDDPSRIEALKEKGKIFFEGEMKRKDGSVFPVDINAHMFELGGEQVVLSVVRDITEQKRTEELFKQSIRDKEALIREIHHRVKNNLSVITGFINMQRDGIEDPTVQSVLEDLENRIMGLDAAQESVYSYDKFATISAQMHFHQVITSTLMNFREKPRIEVDVDAGELEIDVPVAMSTSLVLTEILLISLRHSFEGRDEGRISLKFSKDNGFYEIILSDDGKDLPDINLLSEQYPMGMKIIKEVVEKALKGTYEIKNTKEVRWIIRFPVRND